MQARLNTTRQHVEVVHGLLAWAQAQESVGRLTREQAQQMALRAVAALRYDGSGHFWISDMQPRMLMHPLKPELDGQRLGELKDADGHAPFDAFVATVRNDGKGFVAHRWPEPGNAQARNNVAYVMGFAPWGWILGAAVPVDDLHHGRWREVAWIGGVVASVMLLAAYLFLSFYRVMDGGLRETRRHLRAMTHGDLTTSPSPWGKDESAQLMRELRSMQDSLRGMVLRVRRSSGEIVQASQQIASGATDLSAAHRTRRLGAGAIGRVDGTDLGHRSQHRRAHRGSLARGPAQRRDRRRRRPRDARGGGHDGRHPQRLGDASARSSAPSTASPSRPTSWR